MFQVALTGLLTGLALIIAVGAQNAFLLRQGIRGEQVLPIVLTCLASDVAAMTTGRAIMLTLALTWLNPHFYLDAVLMLGTVANSFGSDRWWFLSGTLV